LRTDLLHPSWRNNLPQRERSFQEPSFKLPFDRAFIRSSSHSIVGGGDFRQTVIAAPSTACTRRAKKQESSQSNCIQSCRTKTLGRIRGQMLSKIGHLQLSE
jgi:hypothetical protein